MLRLLLCLCVLAVPVLVQADPYAQPPTTYLASGFYDSAFRQVAADRPDRPPGRPPYVLKLRGDFGQERDLRTAPAFSVTPTLFDAELNAPIYGGRSFATFATIGYGEYRYDWDDGPGTSYPERLQLGRFSFSVLHFWRPEWTFTYNLRLRANDGGAGFGDALNYGLFVGASWQRRPDAAWRFGLDFSSRRATLPELDFVPFPAAAYVRRLSPEFSFIVGVPFIGFNWQPVRRLQVRLQYLPSDSVETVLSYRPGPFVELALRYLRDGENFFVDDGVYGGDRMFIQASRYAAEAYFNLGRRFRFGLETVYVAGEGSWISDEDDTDREDALLRRDLTNGLIVGLSLRVVI